MPELSTAPSALRRSLDALYVASGVLSALCIVGVAITTFAQIVGRFVGVTVDSTESAGFLLAGSTFLGLAYTFRRGAQIRVSLLLDHVTPAKRRVLDVWSTGMFLLTIAFLVYWTFDLLHFSWKYNEISSGIIAMPLWIPRSTMAVGTLVLLIAVVDTFAVMLSRKQDASKK